MKILWVKTDFLHPTTRGGQIRTLEMVRGLHRRHEVHYVAFDDPAHPEGLERSVEYCTAAHPVRFNPVPKRSIRFGAQLAAGLFSPVPVAGMRWRSQAMRKKVDQLLATHRFDAKVCDFLFPSINIGDLRGWTLFQHNVESVIWERHAASGRTWAHRAYFGLQARRMFAWEKAVCRGASQVISVSEVDEQAMRARFGVERISSVPTGVDLAYFERPASTPARYDLVFVGSMDWMPNIDGVRWFLSEVFPLILARKPDCRVAIVGREPPAALVAEQNARITVTGTVADVRPFLWHTHVSIVPLRIGGGTRLKIFEAMAAATSVVSTTIGAEGLPVHHGDTIRIADSAQAFAAECLELLENREVRERMTAEALELLRAKFSWERVTHSFERTLEAAQNTVTQTA